jgi:hypothetical protein
MGGNINFLPGQVKTAPVKKSPDHAMKQSQKGKRSSINKLR